MAFARNLQGRVLLSQGQVDRGLALLDEAMVAATGGELTPVVTGIVYCSVDRELPPRVRARARARVDRGAVELGATRIRSSGFSPGIAWCTAPKCSR